MQTLAISIKKYYKIARCRCYSHVLGTLIWGQCECRVRSLLGVVRSQRLCSPNFCPFRYRIPGCLAKMPSAFVGGTPLICPLQHRHKFHFLIWWFVTDNLHPGHLSTIVSRLRCVVLHFFLFPIMSEHATRQSERIYSHVLWTMISRRCACRVRSLLAVVRSQRMCIPTFRTFPYRIPGRLAKVPSAFVGGTPLICSPRHRDMFHFLIC